MRSRAACERRRGRRGRRDRGQAAVELALCIPFVCLLVLGVVQVAIIVRDRIVVVAAAREGARAASVSASPAAAAARAAAGSAIGPLRTSTAIAGSAVTVTVRYVDRTDVPLIGALLPDVTVESSITMVLEPP